MTLRNIQIPKETDINKTIGWMCSSLAFVSGRDTEQMANRILKSVLNEIAQKGAVSTGCISGLLDISVQRVNYHIRSLIDSGFLYREKKLIYLRQESVTATIEEMRGDANRMFDNISTIAGEIDLLLGLKNRYEGIQKYQKTAGSRTPKQERK